MSKCFMSSTPVPAKGQEQRGKLRSFSEKSNQQHQTSKADTIMHSAYVGKTEVNIVKKKRGRPKKNECENGIAEKTTDEGDSLHIVEISLPTEKQTNEEMNVSSIKSEYSNNDEYISDAGRGHNDSEKSKDSMKKKKMSKYRSPSRHVLISTPVPGKRKLQNKETQIFCEKSNQQYVTSEVDTGKHSSFNEKKEESIEGIEKNKRDRTRKNKCGNESNGKTTDEGDSSHIVEISLQTEKQINEAVNLSSIKSKSSNNDEFNSDAERGHNNGEKSKDSMKKKKMSKQRSPIKHFLTSTPVPGKRQLQNKETQIFCEKSNQQCVVSEVDTDTHSFFNGKKEESMAHIEKKKRGRPRKNKCGNKSNETTTDEGDRSQIVEKNFQTEKQINEAVNVSPNKSKSSNNDEFNSDAERGHNDGEKSKDSTEKKKMSKQRSPINHFLISTPVPGKRQLQNKETQIFYEKSNQQNKESEVDTDRQSFNRKKVESIEINKRGRTRKNKCGNESNGKTIDEGDSSHIVEISLQTEEQINEEINVSSIIYEFSNNDELNLDAQRRGNYDVNKKKDKVKKDRGSENLTFSDLSEMSGCLSSLNTEENENEKSGKQNKDNCKGLRKRGKLPKKTSCLDSMLEISDTVCEHLDKSVEKVKDEKSDPQHNSLLNISRLEGGNKFKIYMETLDTSRKTKRERRPPKYFTDEYETDISNKSVNKEQTVSIDETSTTRKRGRSKKLKTPVDSMEESGCRTNATPEISNKVSNMHQSINTENGRLLLDEDTRKTKGDVSNHIADTPEAPRVKRRRGLPLKDAAQHQNTLQICQKRKCESLSPFTSVGEDRVGTKERKKRRLSDNDIDVCLDEEWDVIKGRKEKCSGKKIKLKEERVKNNVKIQVKMEGTQRTFECVHCQMQMDSETGIKNHMAIEHQALWAPDCPEGKTDLTSLRQVIQIKKFLNCPKCGKHHNHHHYYKNHLEWCGKEDKTYICELCGGELMARWKKMHQDYCRKKKEEIELGMTQTALTKTDVDGNDGSGKKQKRKAAKKACAMMHDLSKTNDHEWISDDDDKDPDAKLEDNCYSTDDEQKVIKPFPCKNRRGFSRGRTRPDADKMYVAIKNYFEENYLRAVHAKLLPSLSDWTLLSESEAKKYLPNHSKSAEFKFLGKMENTTCLETFEGRFLCGQFSFYTGCPVWRLSWCPVPCDDSTPDQYLAVTGSLDHDKLHPISQTASGPGFIQIWKIPISSNKTVEGSAVPQMEFGIAHDYGFVTDMKWCPSGCWQSPNDPSPLEEQSVVLRLGLLGISCSDSTIRIYSVPQPSSMYKQQTVREPPMVYLAQPVLTLKPSPNPSSHPLTCSSLAWQSTNNHQYMMGGFSDGTVRIWDLCTSSLLLKVNQDLFPFHSFHAHGRVVRGCDWSKMCENYFVTASDDKCLKFWCLDNTESPVSVDKYSAFNAVEWPLLFPGAVSAADDAMTTINNRGRFVEAGHLKCNLQGDLMRNNIFLLTAHNAAIWSLGWSNWLNMAFFADNRGHIYAFPCPHFSVQNPDKKANKYRLSILETELKFKDNVGANERQLEQVNEQDNSKHNVPEIDIKKSDKISMENMPESEPCPRNEVVCSLGKNLPPKNTNSKKKNENKKSKGNVNGYEAIKKDSVVKQSRVWPGSYKEAVEKMCLEYTESVEIKSSAPKNKDEIETKLDSFPLGSLYSIAVNPNYHTCCWLASGGEAGIVRLQNIKPLIMITMPKPNQNRSKLTHKWLT